MSHLSKIKKYSGPVFFFMGLVLLYFLVRKYGINELYTEVTRLGWKISWVLVCPFLWTLAQTGAWYLVLEETGAHISYWELLKIKIGGEAVNTLTPISFMGGDPVRILLLNKTMPAAMSTASVVLDRTIQFVAVITFLAFGVMVARFTLSLPTAWNWMFPLFMLIIIGAVFLFIYGQKQGLFDFISKVLSKIGYKGHLSESLQKKIVEIDERILSFYRHNRKRFLAVFALHIVGRILGVVEIHVIALMLDIPLTFMGALFLATLTAMINTVFVFIPGGMGVLEGAYGILFGILGLPSFSGVAVQLVRRVRTIVWNFIGLAMILLYSKKGKKA